MPAKKKGTTEVKKYLGRPGNNLKIGLVGLPNVGKSSLFNLLGGLQVPAENFPFCTIDPSNTQVAITDPRFDHLCEFWKPAKEIPAVLTVTDIAGLVKGAAEGAGLGNAFLSHIQAVDAIYHVTRAFVDKTIEHVEGNVDPVRDFEIIRNELITKDLEWMSARLEDLNKKMRSKEIKELREQADILEKVIAWLKSGKEVRHADWNNKEVVFLCTLPILTAKPAVYLVNISTSNFTKQQNKWFKAIKEWVNANCPGDAVIPYSATFEQELASRTDPAEKKAYLDEMKIPCSMVPRIVLAGYKCLHMQHFFTTGKDEVRAWTVREGHKAPQAAGVIHGDFEKHFQSAEVYNYDDFKEAGTEEAAKAAGKMRTQGKEYVVKDGDIMFIKHNAGGAGKKKG